MTLAEFIDIYFELADAEDGLITVILYFVELGICIVFMYLSHLNVTRPA